LDRPGATNSSAALWGNEETHRLASTPHETAMRSARRAPSMPSGPRLARHPTDATLANDDPYPRDLLIDELRLDLLPSLPARVSGCSTMSPSPTGSTWSPAPSSATNHRAAVLLAAALALIAHSSPLTRRPTCTTPRINLKAHHSAGHCPSFRSCLILHPRAVLPSDSGSIPACPG